MLGLCDTLSGATAETRARFVVNAAGAWTDAVNDQADIVTPWRHAFSRGVSIALPRDARHTRHVVVDSEIGDALTLAPWGPVAVWASTDTVEHDLTRAQRPTAGDVRALLGEYDRHFRGGPTAAEVVSLRVGVRALAVPRDTGGRVDTAGLTRHHRLHLDDTRGWMSVYGGKLSGCAGLADDVTARIVRRLPRQASTPADSPAAAPPPAPDQVRFPGLGMTVVSPAWAVAHEHCCTLDDYLRRRTNIAQWVTNGGFGARFEHAAELERIALALHDGDVGLAERDLSGYYQAVCDTQALIDEADPGRAARPRAEAAPGASGSGLADDWYLRWRASYVPPSAAPPSSQPAMGRRRWSATARWRHES